MINILICNIHAILQAKSVVIKFLEKGVMQHLLDGQFKDTLPRGEKLIIKMNQHPAGIYSTTSWSEVCNLPHCFSPFISLTKIRRKRWFYNGVGKRERKLISFERCQKLDQSTKIKMKDYFEGREKRIAWKVLQQEIQKWHD